MEKEFGNKASLEKEVRNVDGIGESCGTRRKVGCYSN